MSDYLNKKFPHPKFKTTYPDLRGGMLRSFGVALGGKSVVGMSFSPPYNAEGSGHIEMLGYLSGRMEVIYASPKGKLGTPREVLSALKAYLAKNREHLGPWRKKGLAPEVRVALRKLINDAVDETKRALPGVRLSVYQNGDVEHDIISVSLGVDEERVMRTEFRPKSKETVLHIRADARKGDYFITSFLEEYHFPTLRGLMVALPRITLMLRKGLKTIDQDEAAMFTGKMSTAIVRGVVSTSVEFDAVDEHHGTTLKVELALRSKTKKVPKKIIQDWLSANWRTVQDAIGNVKFPEAATGYREQGLRDYEERESDEDYDDDYSFVDSHEMPTHGLGWLDPRHMSLSDAESISASQQGNRAHARIYWSHR